MVRRACKCDLLRFSHISKSKIRLHHVVLLELSLFFATLFFMSSSTTMQQQDIIITMSVCAVIMTTVFFEHRMQQVEEACARVQSYNNNGSQKAGKYEEMIGGERVDAEDTDERRTEAKMRRHKSNDLMEEGKVEI